MIVAALHSQVAADRKQQRIEGWSPGFPHPERWLKRERWNDEADVEDHPDDCTCGACEARTKAQLTPEQRREIYGD